MADEKKYLDLVGLTQYHSKVKDLIDEKETAGVAQTKADAALASAKNYTDTEVGAVDAKVTALDTKVGSLPADQSSVIGYIDAKTANIASDAVVQGISDRMQAIEDDYLKAADKTALASDIAAAKKAGTDAQAHSEGVAADLATEKTDRETADNALSGRISTLESTIVNLDGAMHFKGVKESLPAVDGFESGDVVLVGEKEYVFDGTEWKEFGDVSAEGKRIGELETRMDTAEGSINRHDQAIDDVRSQVTANKTNIESKLATETEAREAADSALDTRVKTVEDAIGTTGSIKTAIEAAKAEAIETAATDASTKAGAAEANAKSYTDTEVAKDRSRLAALEGDTHSHANKEILDGITEAKVTAWDKVSEKADASTVAAIDTAYKAADTALSERIEAFTAITSTEISALF